MERSHKTGKRAPILVVDAEPRTPLAEKILSPEELEALFDPDANGTAASDFGTSRFVEPDPAAAEPAEPPVAPAASPKLGPTGRPMPDLPEPPPADQARPRPGHRDVQPEGRRRQDHDHDQPRCRRWPSYGRKVLLVDFDPQGSLSVGLGLNPHEMELTHLQPADAARRHPRRGRRAHRRAGHGPAALQHRPVRRRGAAGPRGGPRADPAAGAGAGDRPLRRHPDRLPALARAC